MSLAGIAQILAVRPKKPRLRFIDGLWMCGEWPFYPPYRLGCGFTPAEAYAEWKTQSVTGCALSAAQS